LRYVHARAGEAWRFQHARQGEFAQVVPTVQRVNNAEALAPALRAGLGLALQPEFLAWQVSPIALHIVSPPGRARPARVQTLIDFLAGHFAQAPWAREVPATPWLLALSSRPAGRRGAQRARYLHELVFWLARRSPRTEPCCQRPISHPSWLSRRNAVLR
jgi:hypothetical protein